jgi:hypothetical protein
MPAAALARTAAAVLPVHVGRPARACALDARARARL